MSVRPFLDTIRDVRRGEILNDCEDELLKVIKAVEETGKAGTFTLQLTIKPANKAGGVMTVQDKVTSKLPQLPAGETLMFVTPEFNLQAQDPRQKELNLKAVENGTTELKKVA
ncbi:hypothetical protein [Chitinilyticum aquatile]|uniref:hypothetical protein n=1 Tax=Chitinilyticum aquatile TaxID=362520 RepID=UPI00041AEAD0|nr:hypothetical protein [Chitinilyticum aquatile]